MSVMFASNRAQTTGGSGGHLIEFKAGRSLIEPGSTPEKRKAVASPDPGTVYIKHSQDDQLLHLYWQNRTTSETSIDLIIFPGETEFKQIKECKDGRVFMLKFKTSDERHLFWMQEPVDEKKDEEICKKMNDLLSNPPPSRPASGRAAAAAGQGAGASARFAALSNALGGNMEDIGALGNLDQNQLMRLFSMMNEGSGTAELTNLGQLAAAGAKPEDGGGDATPTAGVGPLGALMRRGEGGTGQTPTKKGGDASAGGSGGGAITSQMLDQIIKAATGGGAAAKSSEKRVDLSTVLTRNKTQEVVDKHSDSLKAHLPDQAPLQKADVELRQTVGNPQFQQAADFFGHALQMGQMGDAFQQFGLNREVVEAAKQGDLREFAVKLTAQENPEHAEVDKQIEADADEVETAAASAAADEAEAKKKEDGKKTPPLKGNEDGMDLD